MASLIKRVGIKGRFAWYVKYIDANGKQKMRRASTDHGEATRLARQWEDEAHRIKRGDIYPQQEQRKIERAKEIGQHVEQYRSAITAPGNTGNHVSYTIADIQKFIAFSGVTHAVNITRPMMDRWKLSLMEAGTDARATINRRVGSVQAFLKWLHGQQILSQYVLLKYGKLSTKGHQKRPRRALSADEVSKLLASAPAERVDLYRFALKTLMRWSQIVALKVSEVNFTGSTLTVPKKDNRHRGLMHIIHMHPELRPILETLCKGKGREDRVWEGKTPRREDAAKLVRADCKTAGVDTTHVGFHALRHTSITRLAELKVHPVKVQKLAGHANVATTLDYYTHFRPADEAEAIALL